MTITGGTALDRDEIDRMMKEAEEHAEEDKQRRESVEARNNADSLVYQTEKLLKEQEDKVSAEDKAKLEAAVAELKTALEGEDLAAISEKHQALTASLQEFSQHLYQNAQQEAAGGEGAAGPDPAASDDEVVDAEIVDEGEERSA